MTDDTQPEAMDLADWLEAVGGGPSAKRCAALLREQHARIAELEAQIEALSGMQALSAAPPALPPYPPLPMQFACSGVFAVYSADQMRAYVDADRAARAPADSVAAPAIGDELRDTLVAVSAAIAERDDRAAQKMIGEILAASPTPPAEARRRYDAAMEQAAPKAAPTRTALPEGWTDCTIEFGNDGPEVVAYGPKRMMTRLAKWLGKYFAQVIAEAAPKAAPGEPIKRGKWAWLPVEPSTAMLIAGNHGQPGDFSALKVWQDMIAALDRSADYTRPLDPPTEAAPQQEAQEPCPTCVALARAVMLDQVSFDRKPDCYGIRQITDDEGVEEWEDIRTSPDVAREEANDMMATGRGEIYEVVPLWTTPQLAPQSAPVCHHRPPCDECAAIAAQRGNK